MKAKCLQIILLRVFSLSAAAYAQSNMPGAQRIIDYPGMTGWCYNSTKEGNDLIIKLGKDF
jgi:hypothetical protein